MRIVIQRVLGASVSIENRVKGSISKGLLIFVGFEEADNEEDVQWIAGKISRLRIFPDAEGVMNLSVSEVKGEILLISQFTLHASTKKGNRPSYIKAARPDVSIPLYEQFIKALETETSQNIQTGVFGAMMEVTLINDGPVTIIIDSKNRD